MTLYPNSVFIIPLSTNRLYTHEIVPSVLPVDMIPTRLGYVMRCSNRKAIYREGQTYIWNEKDHAYVLLEKPVPDGFKKLTNLYFKENTSDDVVEYGDEFLFSLNRGDFDKPFI